MKKEDKKTLIGILIFIVCVLAVNNYIFPSQEESINSVFAPNATRNITITEEAMKVLNLMYQSYTVEFMVCLDGYADAEGYHITSITSTKINDQSETWVRAEHCKRLGALHNHLSIYPNRACKFSHPDSFVSGIRYERYNVRLNCIICGMDTVYCRDPLMDLYKVQIEGVEDIDETKT